MLGNRGIGPAETLRQLVRGRLVGVLPGDRRCSLHCPAEVVFLHELDHFLEIGAVETAAIVVVIEKTRRRRHQDDCGEARRAFHRSQRGRDRTHRMADQDRISQVHFLGDGDDVIGVPIKAGIAPEIVCSQIGLASAREVKQDDLVIALEIRGDIPPHGLVAAEPMSEHDRPLSLAADVHIVPFQDRHRPSRACPALVRFAV